MALFVAGYYSKRQRILRDICCVLAVSIACAILDNAISVHIWHTRPSAQLWLEWLLIIPCLLLGLRFGTMSLRTRQADVIPNTSPLGSPSRPYRAPPELRKRPEDVPTQRIQRSIKRGIDVLAALFLIVLGLPMLLWIIVRIHTSSGGPVFFLHQRVGRAGKMFPCYKFRTMAPNADALLRDLLETDPAAKLEWERDFKLKNDPRITPIGHFLRKSSMDELPQLWNVLKGDMSLVGPRPVVTDELERYGEALPFYIAHRPGITGIWQISGRNDISYTTRVQLDASYVANWTIFTDLVILLKTVKVLFGQQGGY